MKSYEKVVTKVKANSASFQSAMNMIDFTGFAEISFMET